MGSPKEIRFVVAGMFCALRFHLGPPANKLSFTQNAPLPHRSAPAIRRVSPVTSNTVSYSDFHVRALQSEPILPRPIW